MSREVAFDFEKFRAFFQSYSLSGFDRNTQLLDNLSQLHKKYFAFLTFIAELQYQKENPSRGISPFLTDNQLTYLTEACSDIGNAIFISVHGAYKASKLMLRSSIETFCKGIFEDEEPKILTEKSLYAIFDLIMELDSIKQEPSKTVFQTIHNEYKKLCADTHTATTINMAQITALKYFPAYDNKSMNEIKDVIFKLIPSYLFLLGLIYNKYYSKMDYRNKASVITQIKKELRPIIQGVK